MTKQFFFLEFSRTGGGKVFFSDLDYQYYSKLLKAYLDRSSIDLFAFVFLPYSICSIISAHTGKDAIDFFNEVNEGFCDFCRVRDPEKGWDISRSTVIVLNFDEVEKWIECVDELPVSKGLCERTELYSWGSGRARVYNQKGNGYLLTDKKVASIIDQTINWGKQNSARRQ